MQDSSSMRLGRESSQKLNLLKHTIHCRVFVILDFSIAEVFDICIQIDARG